MKFLHTSDLHIGIKLCGYGMAADIAHALSQIVEIAKREGCAAVVLAGDIYDRSNPSPDATALFDSFVTSLTEAGIATLAVSGNHDSPERIAYMSSLLQKNGVYFSPVFDGNTYFVDLCDEHGAVRFFLLPFVRPVNVREVCPEFDGKTYSDAVAYVTRQIAEDNTVPARRVMVTHQFVTAGGEDDICDASEDVGGIGNVKSHVFDGFSYTALGHLHRAHFVGTGADNIRYSGSPLKYSFSEVADEKSVTVVTVGGSGETEVKSVPIFPLHDMREIRGSYAEVTSQSARDSGDIEDYLRIVLTDDGMIQDVAAKLRCIYPNVMRIAYDNNRTKEIQNIPEAAGAEIDALTPDSVFAELFELQNNTAPSDGTMDIVRGLLAECEADFMRGERV